MKAKNKALGLALSAIMIVSATTFGTMAYLTHESTVENTFTVGNVDGTTTAALMFSATGDDYMTDDTCKLVPGHLYYKPMSVSISEGSETAWVFVHVQNDIVELEYATNDAVYYQDEDVAYTTIADQITANGWAAVPEYPGVYYYLGFENEAAPVTDITIPVFDYFAVDGNKVVGGTSEEAEANGKYNENFYYLGDYEGKKLSVTTYVVQSDGLKGPIDAWEKVFGKGGQDPVEFETQSVKDTADSDADGE